MTNLISKNLNNDYFDTRSSFIETTPFAMLVDRPWRSSALENDSFPFEQAWYWLERFTGSTPLPNTESLNCCSVLVTTASLNSMCTTKTILLPPTLLACANLLRTRLFSNSECPRSVMNWRSDLCRSIVFVRLPDIGFTFAYNFTSWKSNTN